MDVNLRPDGEMGRKNQPLRTRKSVTEKAMDPTTGHEDMEQIQVNLQLQLGARPVGFDQNGNAMPTPVWQRLCAKVRPIGFAATPGR